jgi:hypothetical protein
VNWSAGRFLGLLTLFTVAFTSTVPASCAGDTTVHSVVEVQLTDVADILPNLNLVAVVPAAKPLPVTVTLVPPAAGPLFGLRPVTMGVTVNRSASEMALVPQVLVTVTSTFPAGSAGETAVIEVADLTVKLAAPVAPNLTAVAAVKSVPVMVTVLPPLEGPILGFSAVTVGGGPKAMLE